MNIAQLFARSAGRDRDAPALALGAAPLLTYGQLADRAARLGRSLRERFGLLPGDRVAIVMPNRPAYLEIMLAAWWGGQVIVPVNARLHGAELAWVLGHAEAAICFTTCDLAQAMAKHSADLPSSIPTVDVGSCHYARLFSAEPIPLTECATDRLAWLFYTSGTTGRPKGAMITHGNLLAMTAAFLVDVDQVGYREALLHAAPLSHGSGLYVAPFAAMGACQVIPESGGFDAAEICRLVQVWPGTHMFAAPTMVKRLAREVADHAPPLENLATIIYGGAPMYLADLEAAHEVMGFRLAQIYGQGESPMCITALDKHAHERAARAGRLDILRSAGTAQLGVEARIADAEGRPVPPGEPGEIMARGASVVPGYWRDSEASSRTMGDGWLRTGDIGTMDEAGYLTIRDRSKELIISGGSNIYPREVEEVLLANPRVREVAVVGAADSDWGERVVACVVAAEGTTAAELDAWCLARIARFKRPKDYVFLDALPKSSYGKILKRELCAKLAASGQDR